MASGIFGNYSGETHEQFIQRASHVFSTDDVTSWSRIERAVFNHLLGPIIHKFNYGSITDEMLLQCRNDMVEIVRRLVAH